MLEMLKYVILFTYLFIPISLDQYTLAQCCFTLCLITH